VIRVTSDVDRGVFVVTGPDVVDGGFAPTDWRAASEEAEARRREVGGRIVWVTLRPWWG